MRYSSSSPRSFLDPGGWGSSAKARILASTRRKLASGSAARPRSAARVNRISYRLGPGLGSRPPRFLPIGEPQSSADLGVGDPVVGLGQGGPRRLDIETVLRLLDQSFEQLQILDRDDGRGVLAPTMDDDPFPLVLRPV